MMMTGDETMTDVMITGEMTAAATTNAIIAMIDVVVADAVNTTDAMMIWTVIEACTMSNVRTDLELIRLTIDDALRIVLLMVRKTGKGHRPLDKTATTTKRHACQ